jgi:hypothetical protein
MVLLEVQAAVLVVQVIQVDQVLLEHQVKVMLGVIIFHKVVERQQAVEAVLVQRAKMVVQIKVVTAVMDLLHQSQAHQ